MSRIPPEEMSILFFFQHPIEKEKYIIRKLLDDNLRVISDEGGPWSVVGSKSLTKVMAASSLESPSRRKVSAPSTPAPAPAAAAFDSRRSRQHVLFGGAAYGGGSLKAAAAAEQAPEIPSHRSTGAAAAAAAAAAAMEMETNGSSSIPATRAVSFADTTAELQKSFLPATYPCQGCEFKDVELLNNSFLSNFLPGGCATLPVEGLEYKPYAGSQTIIVSYSDITPNATLVYRASNCFGDYDVAEEDVASVASRRGGRERLATGRMRMLPPRKNMHVPSHHQTSNCSCHYYYYSLKK